MIAMKLFCLVLIVAFCSCDGGAISMFEDESENNQLSESWSDETDELVEDDSHNHYRVYKGYSYIYHPGVMYHYDAEKYCKSLGGSLPWHNMLTPLQRSKVVRLFGRINVWLGVRYAFGSWRTPAIKPITHYTFGWNRGAPNYVQTRHCTRICGSNRYVSNIPCYSKISVLCEIKIRKD